MAFNLPNLYYLIDELKKIKNNNYGSILTLSRYVINFNRDDFNSICKSKGFDKVIVNNNDKHGYLYDKEVFTSLGFTTFDSMDINGYEGADIIFDLNKEDIPKNLQNKYDFIIDAGTIEHIFNLPNVLKHIHKMLKVDGTFIFEQPTFYGFNHAYYNFSPITFYEYFTSNNYKINALKHYAWGDLGGSSGRKEIYEIIDLKHDKHLSELLYKDVNGCYMMWGSVTKTKNSTCTNTPQQNFYHNIHNIKQDHIENLHRILKTTNQSAIYLYGTGQHTINLLQFIPNDTRNKIAGIITNNPNEIGNTFAYGYNIFTIEQIQENSTIIISSKDYQEIIYERIKHLQNEDINIIKLYK